MSLIDLAYLGALSLASPYLLYKAVTRPRHLAGLKARLAEPAGLVRQGQGPCVWVHGVSVGEVVASEPLVAALEQALPGCEVVVTTSTQTGQGVAQRKFPGHKVGYFPLDFSWTVRRTFDVVRPSLVVLVELELWPNFLAQARARNVPVVVVNGRISEKSFRGYRLARRFLPFDAVAHYCVQTEQYAERFRKLGVPESRITVTGTMKYDLVRTQNATGDDLRASLGLRPDEVVWIAGSTHFPEERELVELYARLRAERPDLRLVLTPRHNERAAEVQRTVEAAGLVPILRSSGVKATDPKSVVIIDTLGELSKLYGAADLVFVGGSLIPHGGQNFVEPAALGKPVLFGPHVGNFRESQERLLAANAAVQVADARDLGDKLRELLRDPERARAIGRRAIEAIEAAKGATARTVAVIAPLAQGHDTKRGTAAGQDPQRPGLHGAAGGSQGRDLTYAPLHPGG